MPAHDKRSQRYEDILRAIELRKREQAAAPTQSELTSALDGLNIAGMLEYIRKRPPQGLSVYGPRRFTSPLLPLTAERNIWVASAIWHKPKGYLYYEMLSLLGIWAISHTDGILIRLSEKTLTFSAPVFNPESYYHHIKRKFDLHYKGDASPPSTVADLYQVFYQPAERLQLREAIESHLRDWVTAHRSMDSG